MSEIESIAGIVQRTFDGVISELRNGKLVDQESGVRNGLCYLNFLVDYVDSDLRMIVAETLKRDGRLRFVNWPTGDMHYII